MRYAEDSRGFGRMMTLRWSESVRATWERVIRDRKGGRLRRRLTAPKEANEIVLTGRDISRIHPGLGMDGSGFLLHADWPRLLLQGLNPSG